MVHAMYEYDTYGHATIWEWPIADLNRDGEVTISDEEPFAAQYVGSSNVPTDYVFADLDKDGDFDGDDFWIIVGNEYQDPPVELVYSSLGNPFLFTGRETDTWHADDILVDNDPDFQRNQWNRNRNYDLKHGRWIQTDPLGMRSPLELAMVDLRPTSDIVHGSTSSSLPAWRPGLAPHEQSWMTGQLKQMWQYSNGANLLVYVGDNPGANLDPSGLCFWCCPKPCKAGREQKYTDRYMCMGWGTSPALFEDLTAYTEFGGNWSPTDGSPTDCLTAVFPVYYGAISISSGNFGGFHLWKHETTVRCRETSCFVFGKQTYWSIEPASFDDWTDTQSGPVAVTGGYYDLEECKAAAEEKAGG